MKKGMIAAALLTLVLAGALWFWPPLPPPEPPADDGRAALGRIQSALVAAVEGKATSEPCAQALADILAGRIAEANTLLDKVEAEVERRLPTDAQMATDAELAYRQEWLVSYFELLPEADGASPEAQAFNRLVVTLRKMDAVLLAEALPDLKGYDLVTRRSATSPSPLDGAALRLPCRLTRSHPALVEGAARHLGKLAGPLTDCPRAM